MTEHSSIFSEIEDRMNHFYRQTDGKMAFPNSAEGDLLKLVHKALETHSTTRNGPWTMHIQVDVDHEEIPTNLVGGGALLRIEKGLDDLVGDNAVRFSLCVERNDYGS